VAGADAELPAAGAEGCDHAAVDEQDLLAQVDAHRELSSSLDHDVRDQ
jgi:hypothetical protein